MEFHTPLHITPSPVRLDHSTRILTLGSCFANVIGKKLHQNKFNVLVNPFGVIFNPLSLYKLLYVSANMQPGIFKDSFIENNSLWFNYDFHSEFNAPSEKQLEDKINKIINEVNTFLKSADIITFTFGTAFIYKLAKNNSTVANCHKIPSINFKKEFLNTEQVTEGFGNIYKEIKKINPHIKFIITVSPVRHIKDTLELNSVSKSILRTSAHFIREKYPDVEYFPSYEIMMDDLRDYRFYKEDMIHPTETAEKYIWGKFADTFMEDNVKEFLKKWENIQKAIEHKAFNPGSETHKKFIKETINKLSELSTRINVEDEIKILEGQLK